MKTLEHKIALIIGSNGGPDTDKVPLQFAEASAYRLADVLQSPACGFTLHCPPLLGAATTSDAVRQALLDARRAAGPADLLLIAYIGHGRWMEIEAGRSDVYLVTHNFRPADIADDENAGISMRWLQDRLLRWDGPGRLLLLLDCCFAGAIGDARPDSYLRELRRRLEYYLNVQSTLEDGSRAQMRKALTAVGPVHAAYERAGLTVYTAALLDGLLGAAAQSDGRVTWQSLHGYLQERLRAFTPGEYGFDHSGGVALACYPERPHALPAGPPWIMPYPPNPDFVGRVAELAHLAAILTSDEAASAVLLPALAGIGGIGKTQTAIEFAYRSRDAFPGGVFWLSMEQADTIATQVAACGGSRGLRLFDDEPEPNSLRSLHLHEPDGTSRSDTTRGRERLRLQQRVAQVQAVWEGPERRLLIFDNLEDPALLARWRPRGGGCRVLITTRDRTWTSDSGVRLLPLDIMADDESLRLLLEPRAAAWQQALAALITDPREQQAAEAIIHELGSLPLALTLAGRYLADRHLTLAAYLELIRAESLQHTSLNPALRQGLPTGHVAGIIATFALSVARLPKEETSDDSARLIWLAAAQLAPEPLPAEILLRCSGLDLSDPVQRERSEQALLRLQQIGLLERSGSDYRLHRLLAAYARSQSRDQSVDRARAAQALVAEVERLDEDDELWQEPVRYREHLRSMLAHPAWEQQTYGALLHALGLVAYEEDDYASARRYLAEALTIMEQVLGRWHRDTAATLHNLGRVAQAEGDYATARRYLAEALTVKEQVLGRRHRDTRITIGSLLDLYLNSIVETGACAWLAWLLLPPSIDLVMAGIIQIEFMDADPAHPDPARRSAITDAVIADLRSQDYAPQPVATGAMGSDVYEVVRELAQGAAANKDIVLALISGVAAPVALALAERLKRTPPPEAPAQAAAPTPQPVIIIEGTRVVLDEQISDADSLLQRLRTEDPDLAQRVTPQTKVAIRIAVPAAPRRRRR